MLERDELTSGSTFHSAGLVGQLRADPTLTRMNMYSVELYRRLETSEFPVGWTESGGIKLASSPERLEEIRRQISWARTYDLPLHEITPAEVAERFPLVDLDGVVGACLPRLGRSSRPVPTVLLARESRAVARAFVVRQHTRVVGIDVVDGRVAFGANRSGRDRVRDRGRLRWHVRRRDRAPRRRARPARPAVAPVRRHRADRSRTASPAADAA